MAGKAVAHKDRKGRFASTYDPKLAMRVCERIAEGETLSGICAAEGMPDRKTFRRWVVNDPELRKAYDAARELKSHSLFDEALDLARELKGNGLDNATVGARRVAIDTLKWAAGKLNPREYGERSDAGPAIAIQINTPLNLGSADRTSGPAPGENLYTLQASIVLDPAPGGSQAQNVADPRQSDAAALTDARPRKRGGQ